MEPTKFSSGDIEKIIDEISQYEISLEEDPTLPHLKQNYLQRVVKQCRDYLNRVQFYLTMVKKQENRLKKEIKIQETDLELKMASLLADDSIVKNHPSIDERKSAAITKLKDEHIGLHSLRVELLEVEENYKIIKMKYDQLKATSSDIRLQKSLVKDDLDERTLSGGGYDKPTVNQNKSVPGGLPAVVVPDSVSEEDKNKDKDIESFMNKKNDFIL